LNAIQAYIAINADKPVTSLHSLIHSLHNTLRVSWLTEQLSVS
jgi:hypothetical protein